MSSQHVLMYSSNKNDDKDNPKTTQNEKFTNQRQDVEAFSKLEPDSKNLPEEDDYQKTSSFVDQLVEDGALPSLEEGKMPVQLASINQFQHSNVASQQTDAGNHLFICNKFIKCKIRLIIVY